MLTRFEDTNVIPAIAPVANPIANFFPSNGSFDAAHPNNADNAPKSCAYA